jgi:predicted ATPase
LPPAPTPHRDNLPVALTSFVGRADELIRIREAMDSSRLLTLAGAGGAGKTRLALQFSADVVERFADGVWLAELGSLRDSELVVPTVAGALGLLAHDVAEGDEQDDALAERIRDRQILLILDNCEHLVETTARLVHALLVRCPRVTILATSRETLGVPGEVVFRVPPLSLPSPDSNEFDDLTRSDAVALFCERAQLVDRGFGITPSNAGAIAKICRHLDGMPLALELAAARVPILGAHQIAERLDHRLQLLGVGSRTANPRHQTLRAAIDWSYDLLPVGEQIALRHLSVFPGDFDLEAAEAMVGPVAGASNLTGNGFGVMDLLSRLLDKSLILVTGDDGGVRYRLLETIREYAAERLRLGGETHDAHLRHRDFFVAVAEDWQHRVVELWAQEAWISKADIEVHNFRAALEWSLEQGDDEAILRIVGPLGHYWMLSGDIEACAWLERAVATKGSGLVTPQVLARMSLSFMLRDVGSDQGGRSESLLQEAVVLAGDDHHVAGHARFHLADWLVGTGRAGDADSAVRQALAGYEKVQSLSGQGFAYWYLSWPALSRGHVGEARVLLDRSLGLAQQAGDDYLALHALSTRGLVLALSGELDQAEREADQAISVARCSPARQVLVGALTRAAETALLSERSPRAREVLIELLHVLRALGTRRWLAGALEMTAIAVAEDQPRMAGTLFGSAQAIHRLLGEPPVPDGVLAPAVGDCLGLIAHVVDPQLSQVMEQGALLSSDEAIAEALDALGSS